jgi:hypothetical protein
VLVTGEKKRSTSSRGKAKKHGCWRGDGRENVKMPHILGCEKNGPDSKCAFEQNNFMSIRYVTPQASLILRGRVQNSHHSAGGNLPSYLVIGASL